RARRGAAGQARLRTGRRRRANVLRARHPERAAPTQRLRHRRAGARGAGRSSPARSRADAPRRLRCARRPPRRRPRLLRSRLRLSAPSQVVDKAEAARRRVVLPASRGPRSAAVGYSVVGRGHRERVLPIRSRRRRDGGRPMKHWLMKSEPDVFSVDDLAECPGRRTYWDGVRNYQARNYMRDEMKRGDLAFFYHSNCEEPAIVGIMKVVKEGYPDHTAFDPRDPHYDPASTPDAPRWFMVDVK